MQASNQPRYIHEINPFSDGIGTVCQREGFSRCDDLFRNKISTKLLTDRDLNIQVQPGHSTQILNLPQGYSAWERQRTIGRGAGAFDRLIFGHPSGFFDSLPKYFVHYKHCLQYNTSYGCPCCKCSAPGPAIPQSHAGRQTHPAPQMAPVLPAAGPQVHHAASLSTGAAPVPPTLYTIIGAPTISDGTGKECTRGGAVQNDDHFLNAIGKYIAKERHLANGPHRLEKLPDRYSGWEQRRVGGQNDRYISGHPSGKDFRSVSEFVDHLNWLFVGDATAQCPCCLCHGDRRVKDTRGIRGTPATLSLRPGQMVHTVPQAAVDPVEREVLAPRPTRPAIPGFMQARSLPMLGPHNASHTDEIDTVFGGPEEDTIPIEGVSEPVDWAAVYERNGWTPPGTRRERVPPPGTSPEFEAELYDELHAFLHPTQQQSEPPLPQLGAVQEPHLNPVLPEEEQLARGAEGQDVSRVDPNVCLECMSYHAPQAPHDWTGWTFDEEGNPVVEEDPEWMDFE
ncbi:Hypothetical predicted protein [Lecanosticta acicola]|uniref:Cryptic loci regulator 2 N-terminal domain-containing protein n=1 Tax=Lecanosticta acicola TaxID=111012 RepID=A0AAI8Z8X8_9PEZI|nr:Hypothetical predicted protein [Lecanosticta acicola]